MVDFFDKLRERDRKDKKALKEKMGKDLTLYMGDPSLNWGVGGWARAGANLVWGPSGSGKSTLALMAAAEEQKKTGGYVYIFDSEYAHNDPLEEDDDGKLTPKAEKANKRYVAAGLDVSKVYVKSANRVDDLFADLDSIEEMLKKEPEKISAIVVDSWGGIQSEASVRKIQKGEVAAAGNAFGGNAKTTAPIIQTLLRIAAERGVTMFFVQHAMKNMEEYGPRYLMIGGEKLKYLVDAVIFLEAVQSMTASLLEDGSASKDYDHMYKIGKQIRFRCDKSRNLVEGRKSEFFMDFVSCKFALPNASLFYLAVGLGVIGKVQEPVMEETGKNKGKQKVDKDGNLVFKETKGWYEYPVGAPTPIKFHGAPKTIAALGSNVDFYNQVYQDCLGSKTTSTVAEAIGDDPRVEEPKKKGKKDA